MSLAEDAARAGLHRVGARPPFWIYLRQVWRRRQFIYRLARYRIEASNGQNRLGMAWVLLKPIIDAAVYGTVFGFFLMRGNIPDHYILFLVVGVFVFEFFSSCLTSGAKSITRNANLVQSLSFPRMALPLALVTEKLLEFVPMLGIIFATALRILDFQPLHEFLSLVRSIFHDGPGFTAPPEYWLYASVWSVASIVAGSLFFWAAEERYGRVD